MKFKIFYIDDEPELCQVFKDNFIGATDVEVWTYMEPEMALKTIEMYQPDLIFIDYSLPKMTGYDLAHRVNSQALLVVVTGDLNFKVSPPFIKSFTKPYDFGEIEAFVQDLICRKKEGHS